MCKTQTRWLKYAVETAKVAALPNAIHMAIHANLLP